MRIAGWLTNTAAPTDDTAAIPQNTPAPVATFCPRVSSLLPAGPPEKHSPDEGILPPTTATAHTKQAQPAPPAAQAKKKRCPKSFRSTVVFC